MQNLRLRLVDLKKISMANNMAQKLDAKNKRVSKTQIARELGVSRGMMYYEHRRPLVDTEVKNQIEAILTTKGKGSYGHKRLALALKLNKKRILRVMKLYGIKPYRRRRKPPFKKADIGKPESGYKNLIENICPIAPYVIWVCDFTYIKCQHRFIYLAVVMDLYTREVVGFNILRFHTADLVCGALEDALKYTGGIVCVFLHSDQGTEYVSIRHISLAEFLGIKISVSRKGSPWENGYQESFFSQFKLDLGDPNRFASLGELVEEIELIIYRHNNVKMHSVLKMTPIEYRKLWEEKVSNFRREVSVQ